MDKNNRDYEVFKENDYETVEENCMYYSICYYV